MSGSATAIELADRYQAAVNAVTTGIAGIPDDQWVTTVSDETRPIGVVARHIAATQQGIGGLLRQVTETGQSGPSFTEEMIDDNNARQVGEFAGVGKSETLAVFAEATQGFDAYIRGLSDEQLALNAGTFAGNELSVAQVVDFVLTHHFLGHLASINETLSA